MIGDLSYTSVYTEPIPIAGWRYTWAGHGVTPLVILTLESRLGLGLLLHENVADTAMCEKIIILTWYEH